MYAAQIPLKNGSIYCNKNGNIILKIIAKPGAKCNKITGNSYLNMHKIFKYCLHYFILIDITDEGIGIQINAPPVDGEANSELIKFLSSLLGIKKSDVSLNQVNFFKILVIDISMNNNLFQICIL